MTDAVSNVTSGLPGGAGAGHWVLDPQNSSVSISHKTMWGLSTVRGSFSDLKGEGDVGADGSVSGRLEIGAASVSTKHSKRDTHLRSADFFDADAHPRIAFTARSARPDASGGLAVTGDLEVAGKSLPLSFTAKVSEASADSATLAADVVVNRSDYGMTWNQMGMVKGPATVSVAVHFTHQSQ